MRPIHWRFDMVETELGGTLDTIVSMGGGWDDFLGGSARREQAQTIEETF